MNTFRTRSISWATWPLVGLLGLLLMTLAPTANAVPAYSQQTHMACSACHVGAFGPQLTPFGRQFKLLGYALNVGSGLSPKVSLRITEAFTHTQAAQAGGAAPGFGPNDNWELETAALYFAGAISEHSGMFVQVSYSENGKTVGWDMADIRYARTAHFGSHTAIWGITLNNGPGMSDIYNSTPVWMYPYVGPDLAPGAPAAPVLMGTFMNGILGVTAYTQIDGKWYIEAGGYRIPSQSFLNHVNGMDVGRLPSTAPYVRVAYQTNLSAQSNLEIGGLYFAPNLQPMRMGAGTDNYRDYGIDASYEWFGNNYKHSFTMQGLYVHEKQTLNNSYAAGNASNLDNTLNALNVNATYWYENTYGATLAAFNNTGSSDVLLYGGSPNTEGGMVELNWVPFGKNTSWKQPYMNLRVGLQYTFYNKFSGFTSNASDNNTTFLYFDTFF